MKVFVTGATGFIGSATVDMLLKDGHIVSGLARTDDGAKKLQDKGVAAVRADLNSLDVLKAEAAKADATVSATTPLPVYACSFSDTSQCTGKLGRPICARWPARHSILTVGTQIAAKRSCSLSAFRENRFVRYLLDKPLSSRKGVP